MSQFHKCMYYIKEQTAKKYILENKYSYFISSLLFY